MSKLIISAVGDICPGDMAFPGMGVCSNTIKYGSGFTFAKIGDEFHAVDVAIGNLEGMLSETILKKDPAKYRFCGPPEFGKELKKIGFDIVNVANNHVLEYGGKIFEENVKILKTAGLKVCGLKGVGKYYSEPVYLTKKNTKIGVLGYNWIGVDKFKESDKYIAQSRDSIVNYTWDRIEHDYCKNNEIVSEKNINVVNDIKNLKQEVDIVILMTHWGYEFVNVPPISVTQEARAFIEAGADLIIGTHPHVLQGMEAYRNKGIFYSLGNFVFDMMTANSRKTAVLKCELIDGNLNEWEYRPYYINNKFQPQPASKSESESIREIIVKSNAAIISENNKTLLDDNNLYKEYVDKYDKGKWLTLISLILVSVKNPHMVKIITKKFVNTIEIGLKRIKGEKVRW